mmetsp:Transcript_3850/g.4217  ORF Transcript_3850/g.4217 Transcript_3850/m.4217 type:complete len:145 (+) Transcript_3850:291-725(+)
MTTFYSLNSIKTVLSLSSPCFRGNHLAKKKKKSFTKELPLLSSTPSLHHVSSILNLLPVCQGMAPNRKEKTFKRKMEDAILQLPGFFITRCWHAYVSIVCFSQKLYVFVIWHASCPSFLFVISPSSLFYQIFPCELAPTRPTLV